MADREPRVQCRTTGAHVVMAGLLMLTAAGCQGAPSPLDPRTSATARIAELGWLMIALATAVCVVTIGALLAALVVSRRPAGVPEQQLETVGSDGTRVVVLGGMVLPGIVLAAILGYTIFTLREVAGVGGPGGASVAQADHQHPQPAVEQHAGLGGPALALQVTSTQWWWHIRYSDEQVVTANEIHIPAGVPIQLSVTSLDVIHSFWIPQILGKVDMIPGKSNALRFRVDQPGVYRGMCAEFCGTQHARMHLRLFVDTPDQFAIWLAGQQRPAPTAADELLSEGRRVFMQAGCGDCHTVRGTPADGQRGPDLTHLASRRTLGAGTHENNRSNLAQWTVDAQAMKPASKMPSMPIDEAELQPLLAYLESLE